MNIELDREDLRTLLKGIEPFYTIQEHELIKKYGERFKEEVLGENVLGDKKSIRWVWNWKWSEIEKLDEQELYNLYQLCKESWKEI